MHITPTFADSYVLIIAAFWWRRIDANIWIPVWEDMNTRMWVLSYDMDQIRSRPWLEPLVEHLCEKHNLENPLKDDDSDACSVLTESSDSDDYESVPRSPVDSDSSSQGNMSSHDSDRRSRSHAINLLEYLWWYVLVYIVISLMLMVFCQVHFISVIHVLIQYSADLA
jgi:hypothetical protein